MSDASSETTKTESISPERDKTAAKPPRGGLSCVSLALILVLNSLVSSAAVYAYDRYFAPKVAVIDIRGYMEKQKELFLAGKIKESEFSSSIENIDHALKSVGPNTIVISGDAVVRADKKIPIE